MLQNKEASQFLSRVASLPKGPVSLDEVLQPSLQDEAELRKLFATDKGNARLRDIHVGLVDVFAAPSDIRTTRARVIKDGADLDVHHVMALPSCLRREEGSPAMVENLEAFKKNWAIFSEGSLSQLSDWSNVIAAGGSVQACLMPLPKSATGSKRAMRKYFHDKAFPSSDVDLFLYGLTADEAERKIVTIFEAVRDSVPWDVICVRTKHTVSIHSQYPYRNIQIILRLYNSPAEVLAGFDVDAPCCAYNGDRVWANPRAIVSMMRQSNTVDITRRSPSYEVRLAKYCSRGFEVYVPGLKRDEIDPSIYERAMGRVPGLARLLAIEKIAIPEAGNQYQLGRSHLRDRPIIPRPSYTRRGRRPGYRGDLKGNEVFSGLEMSDYDIVNLHIPYGPRWDSKRIEALIFKADFCANSPYIRKNKNRRLHRHSAFFGTVEDCMEDCCELCPEPENEEEHNLQDEEDKSYVRGRIAFIEEDPGRQSISGSFNPIDEGEWSESAYVRATAKFFVAVSKNDVLAVKQMIEDGEDVNRRDHVGRTPLHVAIYSHSLEVGCVLIDAGARMTARLVGGRTSLHLAAQMGQAALVKKMLERSAYNQENAEEKRKTEEAATVKETEGVRMSSEDDWSSEESDDEKPHREPPAYTEKDEPGKDSDPLAVDDNEGVPDVLDSSIRDWDFGYTPLAFAILSGSLEVVDALLTAGADPSLEIYSKYQYDCSAKNTDALHPLALTIYTQDEERAAKIAERLIAAQAISSMADESLFTIFHRIVAAGKTKIVAFLLAHDANAKKVLNSPTWNESVLVFPIVSAIMAGDYATLALLLAHGAKLTYSPEDVSRAENKRNAYLPEVPEYRARICPPIETAIGMYDEVISLLAALGAEVDVPIKSTINNYEKRMSLLQWTSKAISFLESKIAPKPTQTPKDLPDSPAGDTWGQYLAYHAEVLPHCETEDIGHITSRGLFQFRETTRAREGVYPSATKDYLTFAESVLRAHGATLPDGASTSEKPATGETSTQTYATSRGSGYQRLSEYMAIPVHLKVFYDELYEACWKGDNATIQELCLPKHVAEGKEPIQIAVKTMASNDPHALFGWTPLLVALYRRHWDTARLVLAIAKAQYQPGDTELGRKTDPILAHLASLDGSGSDEEEDYSDYSEQEPINFTDIASRPSPVRTPIHPKLMLEMQARHVQAGHKRFSFSPLQKAIVDNDFEALIHTLDLYDFVKTKICSDTGAFNLAVTLDRPEMVDEFIRRSGVGIPIPSVATKARETVSKVSEARVYLGLKVGGKRRVDIENYKQSKRKALTYKYELLRKAISSGAAKVVDYLAGPRPIAAYKHYAETHNDEIAQYLKSIDNLDAVFPELLGWKPDGSNESPLLCAVIADRLDILKQIFALKPSLMEEALLLRVRFVGFNPLLTAAYHCSGTDIVDFLLEKGVDPSERDSRGWNVYHLACVSPNNKKRVKFVEHLLQTLPEELTHELLAQTSKEAFNTPLMLAVKCQMAETARTILKFGMDPVILLLRDVNGSTPLHVAVRKTDTVIAKLLLKYGPTELLYTENCVGQTPLDIASLASLNCLPGGKNRRFLHKPADLSTNIENYLRYHPHRFQLKKQNREIRKLRATLDTLLSDGSIAPGSKLATELLAFADRMEGKLAEETARKRAEEKVGDEGEIRPTKPRGTTAAMYIALRDAAAAHPGLRRLVHLADTQRSAKRSLEQQSVGAFAQRFQLPRATDVEYKESDLEEQQLVADLRKRSLFDTHSSLYDEDRH